MSTSVTPVRATDRVSDVLARDARLIDVFAECSPHFERLRSAAMRKVMGRLVTVEQAARIAGVDAAVLVDALNRAIGAEPAPDGAGAAARPAPAGAAARGPVIQPSVVRPDALARVPGERIVELDVREELSAGREPFPLIMAAVGRVPAEGALRLRAPFEPAPLYAVLERRGFAHHTEQAAPDDWTVWFWRAPAAAEGAGSGGERPAVAAPAPAAPAAAPSPSTSADDAAPEEIWLDVRELEPPEPLVRTLEMVEHLEPGVVLVHRNVRMPHHLFPRLAERGFAYEVEERAGEVLVRIRRAP